MYLIISYVWERRGVDIISNELWHGSIGSWMTQALEEPEHWRLISATAISKEEYDALDGRVG